MQRFPPPNPDHPPPIRRLDSRSSVFGAQGQAGQPPGPPPPQFRPPGPIRYPPPPGGIPPPQNRPVNPNQAPPVRFLQRTPSIDGSGHSYRPPLGPEGYQQQEFRPRPPNPLLQGPPPRFSIDNAPQLRNDSLSGRKMSVGAMQQEPPRMRQKPVG